MKEVTRANLRKQLTESDDAGGTMMAPGGARTFRPDSDVDLLVEFSRPIGLFEFVRLQRELSQILGHRVDLVTPAALKPQLRDRILGEAVVAA